MWCEAGIELYYFLSGTPKLLTSFIEVLPFPTIFSFIHSVIIIKVVLSARHCSMHWKTVGVKKEPEKKNLCPQETYTLLEETAKGYRMPDADTIYEEK